MEISENKPESNHVHLVFELVRNTPVPTSMAPVNNEGVMDSPVIKKAREMALMGAKLINRPAFIGPIRWIP